MLAIFLNMGNLLFQFKNFLLQFGNFLLQFLNIIDREMSHFRQTPSLFVSSLLPSPFFAAHVKFSSSKTSARTSNKSARLSPLPPAMFHHDIPELDLDQAKG